MHIFSNSSDSTPLLIFGNVHYFTHT